MPKYGLCVGAMFKNESTGMKEWLEHYIRRGVDHFYLIDDSSTDNYMEILEPYIEKDIVTLFTTKDWPRRLGRQMNLYNTYILPRLKETQWLLMCDLDEFVWSPIDVNMYNVLSRTCSDLGQIQVNHRLYGSSGHIKQPESIVNSFTKRGKLENVGIIYKYFVNSKFEFASLATHHAIFKNKEYENVKYFLAVTQDYFITNHYCCQSREFWDKIKCTRGDSDAYLVRTEDDFAHWDLNEEEDLGLIIQNEEWEMEQRSKK